MGGGKKHLATGILVVTSLLYFACLPFGDSFAGGLLVSAFGAAMVGGLADWFAVSALFRKPLGISWRTAVIPRNRERLTLMLVQMVQEELLSKENIRQKIAGQNIAGLVLAYLGERGGIKTLKRLLHKLLSDVLDKIDPQAAGQLIAGFVRQDAGRIYLAPMLRAAGGWTLQTGYDQKIISFVAAELADITAKPDMRPLLEEFMTKVMAHYEGDKRRRKLFNNVAGLSPARLAFFAQQQMVSWLTGFSSETHPLRAELRLRLASALERLETEEAAAQLEAWKEQCIAGFDIGVPAARMVDWLLQRAGEQPQDTARWFRQLDSLVDQGVAAFRQNASQQEFVSDMIRQALLSLIESHHDKIGALVRDRLSQLSDADLVSFVETKIGSDLQYIRMNGSVIGGLAGAALYCLTCWL